MADGIAIALIYPRLCKRIRHLREGRSLPEAAWQMTTLELQAMVVAGEAITERHANVGNQGILGAGGQRLRSSHEPLCYREEKA